MTTAAVITTSSFDQGRIKVQQKAGAVRVSDFPLSGELEMEHNQRRKNIHILDLQVCNDQSL